MRTILKWMVTVVLLFLLSGCWDNKDINHRSLPISMGVSYNQGSYTVYLDIPSVSENKEDTKIISDHGDSINEIIDHISMNMESQVDLLHLKVIIVDKAFATHGLAEGIASIIRSRYIAPKTMFVICDEPLDQFFKHIDASSTGDGMEIYDYFKKNAGWSPDIAYTPTWKIFRSIHSLTNDVVIPIIQSGDSTIIKSTGSAIMKNGKMVGRLTNEETLLYNVFNGVNTQGKIEVMGHATVQIVSSRIGNRSRIEQNQPRLKSTVHLKITLMDTRGNPSTVLIKSELQKLVTKEFDQLFKKVQKAEADVFGLGQHFRDDLSRSQLAKWRTDYLPKLKVDVHVKTTVRNTGNLKAGK